MTRWFGIVLLVSRLLLLLILAGDLAAVVVVLGVLELMRAANKIITERAVDIESAVYVQAKYSTGTEYRQSELKGTFECFSSLFPSLCSHSRRLSHVLHSSWWLC